MGAGRPVVATTETRWASRALPVRRMRQRDRRKAARGVVEHRPGCGGRGQLRQHGVPRRRSGAPAASGTRWSAWRRRTGRGRSRRNSIASPSTCGTTACCWAPAGAGGPRTVASRSADRPSNHRLPTTPALSPMIGTRFRPAARRPGSPCHPEPTPPLPLSTRATPVPTARQIASSGSPRRASGCRFGVCLFPDDVERASGTTSRRWTPSGSGRRVLEAARPPGPPAREPPQAARPPAVPCLLQRLLQRRRRHPRRAQNPSAQPGRTGHRSTPPWTTSPRT
jgi:hypothetical protein